MKKLIERMKPENVQILREAEKSFPYSVGAVIKELETQNFWMELKYDTISILVSQLGLKGYDPTEICSIFENE